MIKLFEHNRIAYGVAVSMLKDTGKAAIIHPTGTGKSFIGFKLCEDNPEKTVLWLSPSEYIFKTQLEALKKASGYEPENIEFFTYAKLMNLSDAEISDLHPDYTVLDEFHRAGAEMWGQGVRKLLNAYPDVPVLGLSATNIRYLDNQRDMADEIFEGNIASEMTLGEAIVRGILNPPKYILSIYSYQKDLEKYERRVKLAKNKAVRDAAERYLEALRRALEKAEGLDIIFDKHITDRTGKYIVFCANKEHMDEMISLVPEWFGKVDRSPKIYSVYSYDPEASQSFADFKADNSNHLRLLFCIDALNEGIHVEDVSGVILLRPTVSPIIYKQQIGRALSAGKSKEPVIFDVVNNISGLYSISSVQDEMQEFIKYNRYLGEGENIVNENFEVIDDLKDCKKIFDELETALSASWEYMYDEAKAYFKRYGDLLPGNDYVTEDGTRLGKWLVTQRINYRNGTGISQTRIEKLNSIGMDWRTLHERQWDEGYELAKAYFETHGSLESSNEMSPKLSYWLVKQRQRQRENEMPYEQFEKLSKLGMVWEFEDTWEQKFELAKKYYEENGNLDIPAAYTTEGGTALGAWLRGVKNQYRGGNLSAERIKKLESIGIEWESVLARNWANYYEIAKKYYDEHGDLNVNAHYEINGVKLGTWISSQRESYKKGRLSEEQIKMLGKIGMSWHRFSGKWDNAYEYAKKYAEEHGALDPPAEYKAEDGFALGAWVASQRAKYADGKLKPMQIKRLEALTISWDVLREAWQNGIDHAKAYYAEHGNLNVPGQYECEDGYKLGIWLANQRSKYRSGKLTEERKAALDALGIKWDSNKDRWQTGYEHAQAYYRKNGDLNVPQDYICTDGYTLNNWIASQRKAYKNGKLSGERIDLLNGIGMVWNQNDSKWDNGFRYAASYCKRGGGLPIPQTFITQDGYPLGEWVRSQKRRYRSGRLESDKVRKLAEIGVRLDGSAG